MTTITKAQLEVLFKNAPAGISKEDLQIGYIEKGFEIEGVDTEQAKQYIAQKNAGFPSTNQETTKTATPITPPKIKEEPEGEKGFKGFATGVGKGVLSTVKGAGQLGEKIGNLVLPKSMEIPSVYSDEATKGGLLDEENLKAQGTAEKIGKFGEQVAEFAIPAGKVETLLGKSANMIRKIMTRAATSGTVATVQEGEVGKGTGTAVAVEALFPVVGKFVKGLFRGTGSVVSGMGEESIKDLVKYSKTGKSAVETIKKGGQEQILKDNVKTYIDGITKFRAKMSASFEKALGKLKETDINPDVIRQEGLKALENAGVSIKNGKLDFSATEILNPTLQKRAIKLIESINKFKTLNGESVRDMIKRLETGKFKNPGVDPDRLAYNSLLDDLADGFRNGIDLATDKLKKANFEYSQAKGLVEAVQDILGNVKFKGQEEILAISKKLENLLSLPGLSEDVLTNFFKSIGIDFGEIKAKETVRQVSTKALEQNTLGTNPFEIIRALSSKILTPKMVRDAAILTGQTEKYIREILKDVEPSARGAIIESLMNNK